MSLVSLVASMLKAVIFDLDGVLMEFNLNSKTIKEEVIRFLEGKGLEAGILKPGDPLSAIKDTTRSFFLKRGKDSIWIDELIREAEEIPVGHEIDAARVSKLLPQAKETLTALRLRGLKLAVFTYNNSAATIIALRRHGIEGFFDSVVCRDMVSQPKPNSIHLSAVLKSVEAGVKEAVVVGDSEMDIKPSKELGVRVVAVTTGVRDMEFLKSLNPDYLIDNLYEVVEIVERLSGTSF
jgi:HAD superfamily hydrolase (TIGR01509 family)